MSLQPLGRRSQTVTLTAALFLAAGVWLAADLAAQDPGKNQAPGKSQRVEEDETDPKPGAGKAPADKSKAPPKGRRAEEEEDTPAAPKKVPRVEDDDTPAKPLPGRAGPGAYDLAARAKQSKNRILMTLYSKVKRPHDDITYLKRGPEPVMPVPFFVGDDGPAHWPRGGMPVRGLDAEGDAGKPHNPSQGSVKSVRHFEQISIDAVNDFLQQAPRAADRDKLSREEQLAAAEAVLTAAIRFHESALATGVRKGDEWKDAVEAPLKSRLLDVQLEQLRALADAGNWDAAFGLTAVLAKEYDTPEEQARIARPLADLLSASFKSGIETGEGTRLALRRLRDLEDQFPNRQADKNPLQPISKGLHDYADSLYKKAKGLAAENNADKAGMDQALELMGQAVELWPEKEELRTFQRELMRQHSILRVGVRSLPEFMSPARATTDSELRAVELLFESLVKFGVDPRGNARFVPGLAEGRPKVEALGRSFLLPRNAYWSNNQLLTGADVRFTVDRLVNKTGTGGRLSPAWGQLLEKVRVEGNPHRVSLPMAQGYLEPPALMSFKVLPAGASPVGDENYVDSEPFAKHPVSSGPYRYDPDMNSELGRTCVSFVFNPLYGYRPGKEGLPRIKEVRFFAYKPSEAEGDPTAEFNGTVKLDLLLDLTPAHAVQLKKGGRTATHARVLMPGAGETPTRRVYFLAVNNGKSILREKNVRKAIAHAINREKLLDDFFREKVAAGMGPVLGRRLHAALNGPYPAGSWACNPKVGVPKAAGSLDLFNTERAKFFKKEFAAELEHTAALELKYPEDDPAVKDAMDALCLQLQNVLAIKVKASGVSAHQLRKDVEEGNYDLAYYSYDFPDDTYPLWPLLAPVNEALNIFRSPIGDVDQLFVDARAYRDFARVKQDTWLIHQAFYDTMPLVPLWQLEPLAAVHDCVEAPWFDPLLVFTEVERWKVNPR